MRILIIFIIFISNVNAAGLPNIKNLIINKELKNYESVTFLDIENRVVKLDEYRGKLILLNFWATWCGPCKDEMPSLDKMKKITSLKNLEIFPINVGKDSPKKSNFFFKELDIKNLEIYYDNPETLAKIFSLRGIPTTIIINKNGEEIARIIGSIDFLDKKFINWLSEYN